MLRFKMFIQCLCTDYFLMGTFTIPVTNQNGVLVDFSFAVYCATKTH